MIPHVVLLSIHTITFAWYRQHPLHARFLLQRPALLQALKADDEEVRTSPCLALGQIGDPRAVPVLLAGLGEDQPGDSEPDLRETAARALGGCHDARAVAPLLLCLREPALRKTAAEALTAITGQDFGSDAGAWEKWWKEQKR